MSLFRRARADRPGSPPRHRLVTADTVARLTAYGKGRYDGTGDVWDTWPTIFSATYQELPPSERAGCLHALVATIVPDHGWAVYGAEDLLGPYLDHPGSDPTRDSLFRASLDFQRSGGVWWTALSSQEQTFWQRANPDEEWLPRTEPPTRDDARITPLARGQERRLTALTRADDAKMTYVVRTEDDRYVWQLDHPDDAGHRRRDDRLETTDLYELYLRVGLGMPLPGLWIDPELAAFLPYPAPRL